VIEWRWLAWQELDRDLLYAVLQLRQRVFVVEQACAYLDADGRDPRARHLLGLRGGELVAVLRAFPPDEAGAAVIGRVITAPEARGTGLGRELMRVGMAKVRETWGPGPIHIGAQARLRGWYEALGFAVCGAPYDEDGIPHLPMTTG
jgi:ElaA protein